MKLLRNAIDSKAMSNSKKIWHKTVAGKLNVILLR